MAGGGRELENTRRVQGHQARLRTRGLTLRAVRQPSTRELTQSHRRVQGRQARLHTRPYPKGRSAAWDKGEEGGIGVDDDDSQ